MLSGDSDQRVLLFTAHMGVSMIDFQQPKYRIGDIVFMGHSIWDNCQKTCPDCQGDKHWMVTTPAGESFQTYCRTCWHGFDGCYGTVTQYMYGPQIRRYTIGQVRVEQTGPVAKIQYMCEETGVGSGTLWPEEKLFQLESEARAYAQLETQTRTLEDKDNEDSEQKAQRTKDTFIMEDCPRKKLEDEVNRLTQQVKDLKKKTVRKKKS